MVIKGVDLEYAPSCLINKMYSTYVTKKKSNVCCKFTKKSVRC